MTDLKPTASAKYTLSFFTACVSLGGDENVLLDILGASKNDFNNPAQRYTCDLILDMISHTKNSTSHTSIGLIAGQNFRPDTFGEIGSAVIAADTLRHAHEINDKYQPLTQQFGTTHMEDDGKIVQIVWSPYIEDAERLRPVTEAVFVGCVAIARWLLWDQDAEALTVRFQHAQPCEPDPYVEGYGCQVLYNQPFDCLEYDASLADIKLPQANPRLLKSLMARLDAALHAFVNQNLYGSRVHQCIQYLLNEGVVNLPIVANTLGLSTQVLSRRLLEEGTSFRQILKNVRREAAEYYLIEGVKSISEIALALGYSDQSAFTRAYKSWHKQTPSQWKTKEAAALSVAKQG